MIATADANLGHFGIENQAAVATAWHTNVNDKAYHHGLWVVTTLLSTISNVLMHFVVLCKKSPDAISGSGAVRALVPSLSRRSLICDVGLRCCKELLVPLEGR